VQALRPAAPLEDAAGELVDDLDLAVDDGFVAGAFLERLGALGLFMLFDVGAVIGFVVVFVAV
jgi:hypothetical protein